MGMQEIGMELQELIQKSSISEADKKSIMFIADYFKKRPDPVLASRSIVFRGDAGVGKTFLAEKFVRAIEKEVAWMGCANFSFGNSEKCSSLKEIIKNVNNQKEQVIFFDDLDFILNKDNCEITPEDKRDFMKILEIVKENPNKILVVTLNNMQYLDETMVDRIEVKIDFDVPAEENKKDFLKTFFGKHLSEGQIEHISNNSIGYNYRDLPEVVKLAYRFGDGKINTHSIEKSIKSYKPTQLYGFDVHNGIDLRLKDVVGKKGSVKLIKRTIQLYKSAGLDERLGLKRANMFLFHGPPGTGKTFMARVLGGELGFPIISIKGRDLLGGNPFQNIDRIVRIVSRYKNCIVFIDEADKVLGDARRNPLLGEFNNLIEGAAGKEMKSILIFAVNEIGRSWDAILDRVVSVKFELPSYEERIDFYKNKAGDSGNIVIIESDGNYLASATEGMSFRDMEKVWNELVFHHIETNRPADEEQVDIIIRDLKECGLPDNMFG